MARALSDRSRILRQALSEYPEIGNTELANLLNEQHPTILFKPSDVSAQKQALKKTAGRSSFDDEEPEEDFEEEVDTVRSRPAPRVSPPRPERDRLATGGITPDDVGTLRELAEKAGGIGELIRWLELLREFHG